MVNKTVFSTLRLRYIAEQWLHQAKNLLRCTVCKLHYSLWSAVDHRCTRYICFATCGQMNHIAVHLNWSMAIWTYLALRCTGNVTWMYRRLLTSICDRKDVLDLQCTYRVHRSAIGGMYIAEHCALRAPRNVCIQSWLMSYDRSGLITKMRTLTSFRRKMATWTRSDYIYLFYIELNLFHRRTAMTLCYATPSTACYDDLKRLLHFSFWKGWMKKPHKYIIIFYYYILIIPSSPINSRRVLYKWKWKTTKLS